MRNVHAEVEKCVQEFVVKLTAIVQIAAVDAIGEAIRQTNAAAGGKGAARSAPAATQSAAPKRRGRPGGRSPEQIAATLDRIVAFIEKHPNVRSEVVRKELQLEKPVALDAFKRLRDAKRIKMKGTKNAATYSVA